MPWTEEDEQEFMEMVERRRKLGIPFNPFGRGHKPPTDAELVASIPLKKRLEWAKDDLKIRRPEDCLPNQPQETDLGSADSRSLSRPPPQPNQHQHHHEPDPDA